MLTGRIRKGGRIFRIRNSGAGWICAGQGPLDLAGAEILPPVTPSKIICVGRNYALHARELGNEVPQKPLLFLKPPSAVLKAGGTILIPEESRQVEYEGEIAIVIARRCCRIGPVSDPMDFVAGFTPLNDVTARDLQMLDVQFTRAKSFDTFCPFGPWVARVRDWAALSVTTRLNGAVVQQGKASEMVFPIPDLVRYVAGVMTLLPGDLIATGTPAGVGRIVAGDAITVEVAGILLENTVAERESHHQGAREQREP